MAAVQLLGTDNRPTIAAWFVPAENPSRSTPGTPAVPIGQPPGLAGRPTEPNGARGTQLAFPEPAPMGGNAVASGCAATETALMSAIAAVTAGSMTPGFTYPAETNPLTKLESKKGHRALACKVVSGDAS